LDARGIPLIAKDAMSGAPGSRFLTVTLGFFDFGFNLGNALIEFRKIFSFAGSKTSIRVVNLTTASAKAGTLLRLSVYDPLLP